MNEAGPDPTITMPRDARRPGSSRSWAQTLATHAVLILTAIVGLVLAVGLTVASGSIYGAVVDNDGIAALDQPTLDQAVQQRTETNVQVVTWFTHLGGPVGMTMIAAMITAVMVWRWRSRTPLILMVVAVAGIVDPDHGRQEPRRTGSATARGRGASVRVRLLVPVRARPEQHGDRRHRRLSPRPPAEDPAGPRCSRSSSRRPGPSPWG